MKIGATFFLSVFIPVTFFTGCAQKRLVSPEGQLLQCEGAVVDEAYRTIDKDLDALHDELKTSERVLGKTLDRSVYDTLNRAKQAVRNNDYDKSRHLYRQTIELARDRLVDESTIVSFRRALANIERRLDGKSSCEEAWADLAALEVKQILRRIVIPEFTMEPPATLIDALDFFEKTIRDFDAVERRGVSLILKLPANSPESHSVSNNEDPFAVSGSSTAQNHAPIVPKIHARFINLYDAITLVCDSTGYKFDTRGGFVMITARDDESTKESRDTK